MRPLLSVLFWASHRSIYPSVNPDNTGASLLASALGTGLAYALCNQPLAFNAAPNTQILVAICAALPGLGISFRLNGEPNHSSTATAH